MKIETLKHIIAQGEGEALEFKATTGQRQAACRTLCALLNKNGGAVVFGVTPQGRLTGQPTSDKTRRELFEVFEFEPAADIEVDWVETDPADPTIKAIVCRVERGNRRPYLYDGKPYRRVQSSTTVMGQEEYEAMLAERRGFRSDWELRPNPDLRLDDLDLEEVRRTARRAVRAGRLDDSVDTEDAAALLERMQAQRNGVLLNAAAVLFGKPRLFGYPQLELKMGWFKGRDDREFLDNRHVFGHISALMDEAMSFCFKHLNYAAKVTGVEREEALEIPAEALREALINAFAHRLYDHPGRTVYLAVYDDRLEIKNPGAFPPDFDITRLYEEPRRESTPRNPIIAHVLYLRKTIESWGRGLDLIARELSRVGLPLPSIRVDSGYVTTTFWRPPASSVAPATGSDPESDPETIQSTPENASTTGATTDVTTDAAGPSRGAKSEGPSQQGQVGRPSRFPSVDQARGVSPTTTEVATDETTDVGGPSQRAKSKGQVGGAKSGVEQVVLALGDGPMSSGEIVAALGRRGLSGQLKRTLKTMLTDGLLAYTIPDKPRSSLQQYRLTAQGRALQARLAAEQQDEHHT